MVPIISGWLKMVRLGVLFFCLGSSLVLAQSQSSVEVKYQVALLQRIASKIEVIPTFRGKNLRAKLELSISPDGTLRKRRLTEATGHSLLDASILSAADSSAPFPQPPASSPRREWLLQLVID
jgi:TonB family protein